jgi:hypothetical protein
MPRAFLWFTAIAAFFLALTYDGLFGFFNPDEIMGTYRAWAMFSPLDLLRANLLFFGSENRPLGAVFFKITHALFGFNPLPYHVVCAAICVLNLALQYRLYRILLRQPFVAELALLAGCFHIAMWSAFASTGVIFDLLCQTFYISAFLAYLTRPRWLLLLAAFAILAENSKEMAASLPLVLILYELVFERSWRKHWKPLAVVSAVVAMATIGHSLFDPVMRNPAYHPSFTLQRFLENIQADGTMLLVKSITLPGSVWLLLWIGLVALAWLVRSRVAMFGALFFAAAVLPLAFSTPRYDGYVLYVPYIGCALYAGGMLEPLLAKVPQPEWKRELVAALVLLIAGVQIAERAFFRYRFGPGGSSLVQTLAEDVARACPALPPHSRILLVKDGFDDDIYQSMMILRLRYHDDSLKIDKSPVLHDASSYDHVFIFDGQHYSVR